MILLFFGVGVSLNVVLDVCIFHCIPQRVVLGKLEPIVVVLIVTLTFFDIVVVAVVVGVKLVVVIAVVLLVVVVVGLP